MKFINKSLLSLAGALFAALAIANVSLADPVAGTITFAGGVTLDSTSAATATAVTNWVSPTIQSVSGDFASYTAVGNSVSLNAPWSFNSEAVNSFWSVAGFTFDLTSSSIVFQGFGAVVVNGVGVVSGNGFDAHVGTWSFTTQDQAANGVFSFSGGTSVPDSGTTAILLGTALVGLSVIARRRKAA